VVPSEKRVLFEWNAKFDLAADSMESAGTMGRIDPQQERARLAARYAAMTDLELQKLGRNPAALTEWARSAFLEELEKRGFVWVPEAQMAKPIAEGEILNLLEVCMNRNEAGLVRDFLAQKGMKAYLLEESSGDHEPSSGRKETRLLVRAKDLVAARQQLGEWQKLELPAPEEERGIDPKDRPVVLRRYRDMPAAFVAKSVLDNAGIECFLQDDNVVRMDWLWSNAMGGIKLWVREKDARDAEELLSLGPATQTSGEEQ